MFGFKNVKCPSRFLKVCFEIREVAIRFVFILQNVHVCMPVIIKFVSLLSRQ